MTAHVTESTVMGHRALVLENERVRAVVIPALGGRIWELVDIERAVQWVWHRPGVPLAANAPGADYDAVWAGGWEELFPNDAAGAIEGRSLPDHGEWWTLAWDVESVRSEGDVRVTLVSRTSVRRARCTKEFLLEAGSAAIEVRYRIESEEDEPFHFLFKQHLPLAVSPSCRIAVPGGTVTAVDPAFGSLLRDPGPQPWPPLIAAGGADADLSRVLPSSSRTREFVYVSGLRESWCGVDDESAGASLRMHWDGALLPYLWLFITYGGWRDAHTVVLEPCTNLPKDLTEAVRLGQAARLTPGGIFETRVRVALSALGAW